MQGVTIPPAPSVLSLGWCPGSVWGPSNTLRCRVYHLSFHPGLFYFHICRPPARPPATISTPATLASPSRIPSPCCSTGPWLGRLRLLPSPGVVRPDSILIAPDVASHSFTDVRRPRTHQLLRRLHTDSTQPIYLVGRRSRQNDGRSGRIIPLPGRTEAPTPPLSTSRGTSATRWLHDGT